ncbi:sulfate transporter family-domain-containing protein [Limtongia smithiae]|uniref:sulfate transporter family-domain-containing protein n=1 Tax=Limtongia smithiae TaxID=1125753 RepID=UPI0034CD06AC
MRPKQSEDLATSPNDRSQLLSPDAVSLHSTASTPALTFFRNRVFSFGSASSPAPSSAADVSQYTALDRASISDATTILGAPRRSCSPAHLHRRKLHAAPASPGGPLDYGALSVSGQSISSCDDDAVPIVDEANIETVDPRLYSDRRRDRYRAKSKYYLKYYLPVLTWLPHYPVKAALAGDIIAGLTVASFNIPLSLSYARTLCHVPERYGLLGFAFPQLVYAFMGTVPVMIAGPEPAISVMVGQAITPYIYAGNPSPEESERRAIIYVALITSVHAIMYLLMGFLRLGFVSSLLSTGLLRGFITAVGVVLTFDTLIQALGLSALAAATGASTSSAAVKLGFILTHLKDAHGLSAGISFISFGIIILMRTLRGRYGKKFKVLIYIPDILMIVIFSIIMSYKLDWYGKGTDIVGEIQRPNIQMMSPLTSATTGMLSDVIASAFIIALVGYFQSAVIAKNIFPDPPVDPRLAPPRYPTISPNRELVALGSMNLLGMFMFSLPSIGGYGRSKANKLSGARTQLSSMVFAFSTIVVTFGLLPLIYYLPRPVLAAVLGLICVALLEEFPGDVMSYIRMRAWSELAMVAIVIGITLGVSLQIGVTVGIVISVIQILKTATRARIQVLARVPGTTNSFRDADAPSHDISETDLESLEKFSNVLIVRIPEPLSFANTGELEQRLRRLDRYGTMRMHPSLPALRNSEQNVVMDFEGMSACDTTSVEVLCKVVSAYRAKGRYVLFARVPPIKSTMLLFKRAGLSKLLSYNGHPPAYFATLDGALEALDECIYEMPGNWTEEDEENAIAHMNNNEEVEELEEDSMLETEVDSMSDDNEKSALRKDMV